MGRAPCCEKVGLRRGRWNDEEDRILSDYIQANGEGSWRSLPKKAGLLRCGKSCRLRWINYLRCDVKRGNISKDEEDMIIKLHATIGNRWSLIASRLASGRTDNEIKNYWNSHLRRKITPTTTTKRKKRSPAVKTKKPLIPPISTTLSSSNNSSSSSSDHKEKDSPSQDKLNSEKLIRLPVYSDDNDMGEGDQQVKNDSVSAIAKNGSQQQQEMDIWECDWDFERFELDGLEDGEDNINSMLSSWPWDEDDTTLQTPTPLLTQDAIIAWLFS